MPSSPTGNDLPKDNPKDNLRPMVAYVLPMAVFLGLTGLESWQPVRPFYPVVYTIKILIVTLTWWYFRNEYPTFDRRGWLLGCLTGLFGVLAWVGLSQLALDSLLGTHLPDWLSPEERAGYNPFSELSHPFTQWAFIAIRLFGLAVTVPLVEEVFWRGFLMRFLIDSDFVSVPLGQFTPFSFLGVTILFTLAHPELLAASVWCAAINVLLYRTRNLWSCIFAHSTTNALLGLYILYSGNWTFW
jgi:uncharacterized protein